MGKKQKIETESGFLEVGISGSGPILCFVLKNFIVLRQGSPELDEGLSMNGRNYTDFKMATVRPEPVEGWIFIFARGSD